MPLEIVRNDISSSLLEFLFFGANMDAIEAAGHIGIHADRAVTYQCDAAGTALNYEVLEKAIHHVR